MFLIKLLLYTKGARHKSHIIEIKISTVENKWSHISHTDYEWSSFWETAAADAEASFLFVNWNKRCDTDIPCQSNNMWQARQYRAQIMITGRRCWVCCVPNHVKVHQAVWLLGETLRNETSQNWHYDQTPTHSHKKIRTILPRITVTLTMTQITLLTQTSQTGLTVQTVNLLYLQFTGLQGGPCGLWQIQPPHINNDPSPFGILTARQGRQAPSTSQLKRLDTRHNRHWFMQCKRIQCCVWSTCIYEDQLTLTL